LSKTLQGDSNMESIQNKSRKSNAARVSCNRGDAPALATVRALLSGLPRDWRTAADSIGVTVLPVHDLYGAEFAVQEEESTVIAAIGDDDCLWSAWGGIALLVAHREGVVIGFGELCALANERKAAELAQ
jgi:hypothetical protein